MKFLFSLLLTFYCLNADAKFDSLKHPVRSLGFWMNLKAKPLAEKIGLKPPSELIDYLRKDNKANGWKNIPATINVSTDFLTDVKSAVSELPLPILQKINEKLIGVFLVSDLGGSGYSEYVSDENGLVVAALVVLDVNALDRTANQWATWKESSPFHFSKMEQFFATIESPTDDNRKNAIQYILLHEFGHVLAAGSPLLPPGGVYPKEIVVKPDMNFFNLSWAINKNEFVSRFDANWKIRPKIHYYANQDQQIDSSLGIEAYRGLLKTNFSTLYAATHPADDFAETFANYVHVVLMSKPWKIHFAKGPIAIDYSSCWNESRCAEKKFIITELIGK